MQQDMFGTKTQKYKYFSIRDILGFYAAIQIMFGTVFCSLGGSYWLINWWMLCTILSKGIYSVFMGSFRLCLGQCTVAQIYSGYTRFKCGASDYVWDSTAKLLATPSDKQVDECYYPLKRDILGFYAELQIMFGTVYTIAQVGAIG